MPQQTIIWEPATKERFDAMVAKIPLFHREIAKIVVHKKATMNAQARQADHITDEDVIKAFFSEVPKAFYSLMVRLMDEAGYDYQQYGL